jgi:hypothetical protein
MTKLDTRASEFEPTEAVVSYDHWFREKIERAVADMAPPMPHARAMVRARAAIKNAAERQKHV